MFNYTSNRESLYGPSNLAIHSFAPGIGEISKCDNNFIQMVFFDDTVHIIVRENRVTGVDFDYGITFYNEPSTKFKNNERGRKNFSTTCKNRKCLPNNDQKNDFLVSSVALISFWSPIVYGTGILQLLCH